MNGGMSHLESEAVLTVSFFSRVLNGYDLVVLDFENVQCSLSEHRQTVRNTQQKQHTNSL